MKLFNVCTMAGILGVGMLTISTRWMLTFSATISAASIGQASKRRGTCRAMSGLRAKATPRRAKVMSGLFLARRGAGRFQAAMEICM